MTVSYSSSCATSRGFGCFLKLLLKWKGSIYKLIWCELLLYIGIYYAFMFLYWNVMDNELKIFLKNMSSYCGNYISLIPMSFVLGFYVDKVMTRWWEQYQCIPYPDNLAILVAASIKGEDNKSRAYRRSIVRYATLSFTMTTSMISPKVKKRFPTLEHFLVAGLLTNEEKKLIEELDSEYPSYFKYWLPISWAANLITQARHEGYIQQDECVDKILEELNTFRGKLGALLDYDWICIPLVYTQTVTIAVYTYFLMSIISNLHIPNGKYETAAVPVVPLLEYIFYMGWLKVAETLTNPFGEDDDDFEVVWLTDRHLQVSYILVDKIHNKTPKLVKDIFWDNVVPDMLPHTKASKNYCFEYPQSSTDKLLLRNSQQEILSDDALIADIFDNPKPNRHFSKNSTKLQSVSFGALMNNSVDSEQEVQNEESEYDQSCDEKFDKLIKERQNHRKRRQQEQSKLFIKE